MIVVGCSPASRLWESGGCPAPIDESKRTADGAEYKCGLCLEECAKGSYKVTDIVSDNSTIWDDLTQTGGHRPILCGACAWAFRMDGARRFAYAVYGNGGERLSFMEASKILLSPLPDDVSLSVPITGRKHTLPYMAWGSVSTDAQKRIPWRKEEAALARSVRRLREGGASWASIEQAQPNSFSRSISTVEIDGWLLLKKWKGSPQLKFISALMRKSGLAPGETQ